MATSNRPARVASEFQHELTRLLARGLKDPRITGFVTITGAKMGPDLKDVTVYVSIHGDERTRDGTLAGLRAAAGFLQREAARNLRLRHTPHLRFVYDESIARGDRIDRLLREAKARDAQAHGDGGEAAAESGSGEPSGDRPLSEARAKDAQAHGDSGEVAAESGEPSGDRPLSPTGGEG